MGEGARRGAAAAASAVAAAASSAAAVAAAVAAAAAAASAISASVSPGLAASAEMDRRRASVTSAPFTACLRDASFDVRDACLCRISSKFRTFI